MKITIYPFPASDNHNPFLDAFYREINHAVHDDVAFDVAPRSLKELVRNTRSGSAQKNIIHIHWSAQLYGSRFVLKSLSLMAVNFYRLLILKKRYSFRIIWTMHNFKSHDYPHPTVDRLGRKILSSLADCIIVQQQSAQESLVVRYPKKKIVFIPLGNYVDFYGRPAAPPLETRRQFGFQADDLVLLSFGMVRPYKKIEAIIDVLRENDGLIDPAIKLLIIGPATDSYAKRIDTLIAGDRRITFINRFVDDQEVPNLFSIADYSIFWFDDSVLTSSGIDLSLSYGIPVIARNTPTAEMITDTKAGFLFNNAEELLALLKKLPQVHKPAEHDVIDTVVKNTWPSVAKKFMDVCINLGN